MNDLNSIPHVEKGNGPPLIFLHGFMCSKEHFLPQINFLSNDFKVIAYDLYGFGENIPANQIYSLEDYANEFLNFAKNYGKKVKVVAHSFGCRVLLKSTAIAPDFVEKAVLCGAAGLKPNFSLNKFFKKKVYKILKPFFKKEKLERSFFSSDYNMLDKVMKESFKRVTSEYLDDLLPKIKFPVLAVFGENDKQTPCSIADKLVLKIPDCGKHIMKGCGHFCYAERPYEFNNVIREFLI